MWGDSGSAGPHGGTWASCCSTCRRSPAYLRIIRARIAESRKPAGPEPAGIPEENKDE